jgi:SAM-dependent methyltransferase
MNKSMKEHWNNIYSSKPTTQLGWYEADPSPSLELLERCALDKNAPILDVGAGATMFVDCAIDRGYQKIIAVDISKIALIKLQTRLGSEKAARVRWVNDDITSPSSILELSGVAVWHDRAMLHFLIKEEQRATYVSALQRVLRPGGYAIISAFAVGGATKCSGLDVKNYDDKSLEALLGDEFELLESLAYTYKQPSGGLRPFVYTRFRKSA